MARMWLGLVCAAAVAGGAQAHFFFLLPPDDANPAVRLVLGDTARPDPEAQVDLGRSGQFWVRTGSGKVAPAKIGTGSGDGWLSLEPVADAAEAFGTVEAGVVVRGQPDPVLLVHHPRAVLAPLGPARPAPESHRDRPLEITPVVRGGGVAFRVTAAGEPVGSADVVVEVPGEKRPRAVKTDAAGVTPAFEAAGTYAARAMRVEARAGEFQGRAYKQVRHYATLVVRHDAGR